MRVAGSQRFGTGPIISQLDNLRYVITLLCRVSILGTDGQWQLRFHGSRKSRTGGNRIDNQKEHFSVAGLYSRIDDDEHAVPGNTCGCTMAARGHDIRRQVFRGAGSQEKETQAAQEISQQAAGLQSFPQWFYYAQPFWNNEISMRTTTTSMTAMVMTSQTMPGAETAMKNGVAGSNAHTASVPTHGPTMAATRAAATVRLTDLV
jgi:hypothetical protein